MLWSRGEGVHGQAQSFDSFLPHIAMQESHLSP